MSSTKRSVTESWARGYAPLVEACRELFGFLVREHGFAEPEIIIAPPSALITLRRGDDFVRLESEYAGAPFTSVRIGHQAPIALLSLITERDPAYVVKRPWPKSAVLSGDEMRAAVAYDAAFVSRHPEILHDAITVRPPRG